MTCDLAAWQIHRVRGVGQVTATTPRSAVIVLLRGPGQRYDQGDQTIRAGSRVLLKFRSSQGPEGHFEGKRR
jgi:hypothetical protein